MMYHHGDMISKGSCALEALFAERGAQNQTATAIDIKPSLLVRWRKGEQKPDARYRALLQDKLGIDWRSWDEPAEQQIDQVSP